ncbi:MAG: DUF420 domain-containing protein [Myxococcota bacterium]|nr:DUF420 domain-containing protein [Myxococcota bacterium]
MDPKLAYWTGATLNMATLVLLAFAGIRGARGGKVARHRRLMLLAASLVVAFVLSYALKLLALGREDLETWSSGAIWTLRFHEACILVMLTSGGLTLKKGLALSRTRAANKDSNLPSPLPGEIERHGRSGRIAVYAASLGLLSACAVLAGMYQRAAL